MIALLKELRDNDKIRCIVTTGAGNSYSSGLDLYDLRESWKRKRRWDEGGSTYEIVRLLRAVPQVTVAAINGWCLGGGLALPNGHDLAVSGESAMFGMPEVIRGSYGAVATSTLFHSGIPFKKAFYIQLTGRNLNRRRGGTCWTGFSGSAGQPADPLCRAARERAWFAATESTLESAKIAAYMEKDLDFRYGAENRRSGVASNEILHQSFERRGRLSPLAEGRREHELRQTGGSKKMTALRSREETEMLHFVQHDTKAMLRLARTVTLSGAKGLTFN